MEGLARVEEDLRGRPRRFLVTGGAGFIGSHIVERLLRLGQQVVVLDSLATGKQENLDEAVAAAGEGATGRLRFLKADIRSPEACRDACAGVEVVLHQAALGSVPRSLLDPFTTHEVNVDGFLRVLLAAREAGVKRVVYASSSSVYGDEPALPKREDRLGRALSPYALGKRIDELYAENFQSCYGTESIGLRYFNVFGRRQDPEGAYAAVLPRWIAGMLDGRPTEIHGDGETSRDFCHVDNAVEANLLAGTVAAGSPAVNQVYNVACGDRTTLNELHGMVRELLAAEVPGLVIAPPVHAPFRPGDIRHSLADVTKARTLLGYAGGRKVRDGLALAMPWYVKRARRRSAS